jgi:hypothetical protein
MSTRSSNDQTVYMYVKNTIQYKENTMVIMSTRLRTPALQEQKV